MIDKQDCLDRVHSLVRDSKASRGHYYWHILAFWYGRENCTYCDKCIFGSDFGISKCARIYKMERYLR